jgi:hypothetical protein
MFPFNLHYCSYKGWQKELPFHRVILLTVRCGLGGRDPRIRQKPGDGGGGAPLLVLYFLSLPLCLKPGAVSRRKLRRKVEHISGERSGRRAVVARDVDLM